MMIKNTVTRHICQAAIVICSLGLFSTVAHADDVDPKVAGKIVAALQKARPDFNVSVIRSAPIAGLYQAQIENGPTIYVTKDGGYFIAGDLFEVKPDKLVNMTEFGRNGERAAGLAKLAAGDMITFSPKGETKAHVSVFTDIDCGYCRKLHQEVPALNELGIEVRYLGYPRAGLGSESHKKLVTAWCAEKPQEVLTEFKNGVAVPINECENDAVATGYNLGRELGVTATPAIIFESGELQLGYMPAADLAARLGVK